jgi:hypothetical protein
VEPTGKLVVINRPWGDISRWRQDRPSKMAHSFPQLGSGVSCRGEGGTMKRIFIKIALVADVGWLVSLTRRAQISFEDSGITCRLDQSWCSTRSPESESLSHRWHRRSSTSFQS